MRVYKSHIMNFTYVKSYPKNSGGYVTLEDNTEIEISSSYKDEFLKMFK
jgi:two-component system LytT family response regulator